MQFWIINEQNYQTLFQKCILYESFYEKFKLKGDFKCVIALFRHKFPVNF